MRHRTSGPYACSEVASLIAAQRIRTDGSAVRIACSRSFENVAMPHWRGGQVLTRPTLKLRGKAVTSGIRIRWSGLGAEPVEDVRELRAHQRDTGVSRAVIQAELAGCVIQRCATREHHVGDITGDLVWRAGPDNPTVATAQDAA